MIGESTFDIKKILLSLLILTGLVSSIYSQDKKISGVINIYKRVEAIGTSPNDNVTVNNADNLTIGDTVLLIQMKGASIIIDNDASYGLQQGYSGAPGMSEFLIIEDILGNTITFTGDIINNYDPDGQVQLIKVPFYNAVTVDATLTCQTWDSLTGTGGVLAMIVGRTLILDGADIDVTGKGFKGGAVTLVGDSCIKLKPSSLNKFSYPGSYGKSGYKGESPVSRAFIDPSYPSVFPGYIKGKGANFTGGGGGNGRFSGGGGGSNWGGGGRGGLEIATCAPGNVGGVGGLPVFSSDLDYYLDGNFYMGGGGGSSTYETGNTSATPGARGGGIIIIVCDTLKGNGRIITAEGSSPNTAGAVSGNAGAGGGGGGGSIAIYLQSYSASSASSLIISANGGKGGNTLNSFGEGGGGGGGLILTNDIYKPSNVSKSYAGGQGGTKQGGVTGTAGQAGDSLNNFSPLLNGFLFNSIRSTVTGNQVDSICSNVPFGVISGTKPFGGTEPFTIKWISSTVSKNSGYSVAPGINNQQDYTPPDTLTQTTWFRRVVNDSGTPQLIDSSKSLVIKVQPFIKFNEIGVSDTICFAQDPPAFIPTAALQDGNGIYYYKWEISTDNINYSTPGNINTSEGYTPLPALDITSYYRRTVTSGRCVDSSAAAIAKITVLPLIANNNITNSPPDICYGSTFANLAASVPPVLSGGDITYRISWETSLNGSSGWGAAAGTMITGGFNPDELSPSFPGSLYYRRVVKSGSHNVCVDYSDPVLLNDWPVIANNTIKTSTSNIPICSGSDAPKLVDALTLTGGNSTYTYTWEYSTKTQPWTLISGATNAYYTPTSLVDTTDFRRTVHSSACSDISNTIRINVHRPITDNDISLLSALQDTTVCNGANPNRLTGLTPKGGSGIPGDFTFKWQISNDGTSFTDIAGANTLNYDPPVRTASSAPLIYSYRRLVSSGACLNDVSDPMVSIRVLPSIANNTISTARTTVCYDTPPDIISGTSVTGGEGSGTYTYLWKQSSDGGVNWIDAVGTNNLATFQAPALKIPMKYFRIVKSGDSDCCSSTSNTLSVGIYQLPTAAITNTADTSVCGGSDLLIKLHLTGADPLDVTITDDKSNLSVFPGSSDKDQLSITPASVNESDTYIYSITKVEDNNGCVAKSLLGTKKGIVYKIPVAYAGEDAIVCGHKTELKATPSYGTGKWYENSGELGTNPSFIVTVDSLYPSLGSVEHTYKWKEINMLGQCFSEDEVKIRFDKRIYTIDAGPDVDLFSIYLSYNMQAKPPESWEADNALWEVYKGNGSFDDLKDPNAEVSGLPSGLNSFIWRITNGECDNEDTVNIEVIELDIKDGFSPNNDGTNDNFVISGIDLNPVSQVVEFEVRNGAGTMVFSASNQNGADSWKDWDGKNSKGIDLPEGTYYYLLKIISNRVPDGLYTKNGFIVLKRN